MLLFTTREDSDKFLCEGRETGSVEHLAEGIEFRIKTRNTEESEGTCAMPAKQSKATDCQRVRSLGSWDGEDRRTETNAGNIWQLLLLLLGTAGTF